MSERVRSIVLPVMSLLGVAIAIIGFFLPIAQERILLRPSELVPPDTFTDTMTMSDALMRFSIGAPRGSALWILFALPDLAWLVAALGGLLLIPLLGQRLRFWTALTRRSYTAWVALTTLVLLTAGLGLARTATTTTSGAGSIRSVTFAGLLPGAIVAPLGLALCGATLMLLYRAQLDRKGVTASVPARQGGWATFARISVIVVTLGMIVWALGFYALPWAMTNGCDGVTISFNHFANGACAGVDFGDALAQMRNTEPGIFEFLAQPLPLLFMYGTLLGWAILFVVASWLRTLPPERVGWMALWVLLTSALSIVALGGVSEIDKHGFQLTTEAGQRWVTGPGVGVSFAGLILVVAGTLGLIWMAWRDARGSAASVDQADAPMWYAHP